MTLVNPRMATGTLFQIGNGVFGAGASAVHSIVVTGTPTAGNLVFNFWGQPVSVSVASGLPTASALQTAINAAFPNYAANSISVAFATGTYTITYQDSLAFMPVALPTVDFSGATGITAVAITQTTPGQTRETFATLAQVTTMPFPAPKRGNKDVTSFDSPNLYRQFIPDYKDAGDVRLDLNFINDVTQNYATGLISQFEGGQIYDYRIIVATTSPSAGQTIYGISYYYSGFLTELSPTGAKPEDLLALSATIKITGPVSYFPPLS